MNECKLGASPARRTGRHRARAGFFCAVAAAFAFAGRGAAGGGFAGSFAAAFTGSGRAGAR